MELGNFLGKLKGESKSEPKKFLALILTDEVVQAAIWNVVNEQTEIVAIGTPVEWDGDTGTTSELVTAVDATISNAIEGLSAEPNEFILGIPHSWTDKNGVLGVKREFINKIRKELDLNAIGYVVITDSVISYLKMQEGTPTTSILIQVSRDELTLVLVRLGRIESIETIGRSDDVVEDVTEGIARFKVMENLPSRIILFNSMHSLDEIIQNLLSVDWQNQFNFLHIPKIESLGKDVAIRALSVAGGSEIAKKLGFTISEVRSESKDPVESGYVIDETEDAVESNEVEADGSEPELLTAQEIGFTTSDNIDFVTNDSTTDESVETAEVIEEDEPIKAKTKTPMTIPKLKIPKLSMPKLNFHMPSAKPVWWIVLAVIIGLGGFLYWFTWVLPSAMVTVHVTPRNLEEKVDLTLSTTESSINFADRVVPARLEIVSESGEKSKETTGKRTIGDPGHGEVTIYNRTSANKNFTKGTLLTAGSLKFTLDADVNVASKSAGNDYVDVPGKATVGATAQAIGAEGNIKADSEFTIASFGKDSYVAKNESAFSGGSSEEVQVVSKDDLVGLEKELKDELLANLITSASSNSASGEGVYLIENSADVKNATFSNKLGETATTLSLTLDLEASMLRYATENVTTLVNSTIDQKVPSGFVRSDIPSTVDLEASEISDDETSIKGTASVGVSLLPVVETVSIQNALKGKQAKSIGEALSALVPGYVDAEVQVKPSWIPTRLKSIPRNPKNITISITPTPL